MAVRSGIRLEQPLFSFEKELTINPVVLVEDIATGCEYPANMSFDKARIMVEAAKKYGQY